MTEEQRLRIITEAGDEAVNLLYTVTLPGKETFLKAHLRNGDLIVMMSKRENPRLFDAIMLWWEKRDAKKTRLQFRGKATVKELLEKFGELRRRID